MDAGSFLRSIIKQRKTLDALGKSKSATAGQDALEIEKYLDAYPHRDEQQMARFWLNNKDKIHNIIPGVRSGSSSSTTEKFDQLTFQANRLNHSPIFTNKSNNYGHHHHPQIG